MKKLVILMLLCPMLLMGQTKSKSFLELNLGGANFDLFSADRDPGLSFFPGASFLFGQTKSFSKKGIFEYQAGIAAPSIVTGKVAVGVGSLDHNVTFAVRPWPLTFGPQYKYKWFSASIEIGTGSEISMGSVLIASVGFRYSWKSSKKNIAREDSIFRK